MKIGLIKETKTPIDNRVALTPSQTKMLMECFPDSEIVAESSDVRAYTDDEYKSLGIQVVNDLSDCDVLFGIKEATIDSIIPNKHYFFFGHIAKMQEYNRPLIKAMLNKKITFSDYEYLVDGDGKRVCAFGWWAGVVGVYYTLRGYGLKYRLYELPKPDLRFTIKQLLDSLKSIELPKVKVLVTGAGRVSQGAQYVLNEIGANKIDENEYLSIDNVNALAYCVADVNRLVKRKDGKDFTWSDFSNNATEYESDFIKFAKKTDVLISAHFWAPDAPVYLGEDDLRRDDLRIKMIGDVTCDIMGSIKSTVRSSTHDKPYFDYNPVTGKEEEAFSSDNNITVMAVDTCPNALALDASEYFGDMLIEHVFKPMLNDASKCNSVVENATIIRDGKLTPHYQYLEDFAK
ncbi:MAG: alanine dehydrogenase [Lentimicrobiaceae bacterium]|nr:alanine dehydrogenase [Lentimicrobiaceae bacterium]